MNDKILDRFMHRTQPDSVNENNASDETEIEDFGTFGFLRGSRERAAMLELRRKDGNILAVPYGWLEKIEFNPSEGITLYVAGNKVRITGRNLNCEGTRPKIKLFEGIARHRVPWVREINEPESMRARDGDTVVDLIDW